MFDETVIQDWRQINNKQEEEIIAMELIDKSALVAEIERRVEAIRKSFNEPSILSVIGRTYGVDRTYASAQSDAFKSLLTFLDTLEVKEVDCEREIGSYTTKELLKKRNHSTGVFHITQTDINSIAKHFYELGLNVNKGK